MYSIYEAFPSSFGMCRRSTLASWSTGGNDTVTFLKICRLWAYAEDVRDAEDQELPSVPYVGNPDLLFQTGYLHFSEKRYESAFVNFKKSKDREYAQRIVHFPLSFLPTIFHSSRLRRSVCQQCQEPGSASYSVFFFCLSPTSFYRIELATENR